MLSTDDVTVPSKFKLTADDPLGYSLTSSSRLREDVAIIASPEPQDKTGALVER